MDFSRMKANFDRFKKCCTPIVLTSMVFGILDMTIGIPGSAFISILKMSDGTWTQKNRVMSTVILAYSMASAAIGVLTIPLTIAIPCLQTALTVASRVFSIVLLCIIFFQDNVTSTGLFVLWFIIMFGGFIQVVFELMGISNDKKSIKDSYYLLYAKSWLPALGFTALAMIIVSLALTPRFATDQFQYAFFTLYTFGLEMTATATYFITAIKMGTGKTSNTPIKKELVKNIRMHDIPDKVGRTTILSRLTK